MAYTTIDLPTDYFNTKLYTGNGSTQSITGVGFQPDWVWIKQRNGTEWHNLIDSIRGGTKVVYSNETNAEATSSSLISSFDSDGFSIGNAAEVNGNTNTFVSWNWLAGGSASSNTQGDITSSVSANTTAGFSIVSYTGNGSAGATIGHGLGVTPAMIIQKIRSSTGNWLVYHHKNTSAPETDFLRLNTTNATADEVTIFNDTAPTNSVFSVGTENTINGNGVTCIAYCFAEKQGYSKFGSYTGNGNVDGPFAYTGFKPSIVICKKSSSTGNWELYDNKRNGFNGGNVRVIPDSNDAESGTGRFSLLSNGFKITTSSGNLNGSGDSFIYMAFAESPFVTSTGISTTAR